MPTSTSDLLWPYGTWKKKAKNTMTKNTENINKYLEEISSGILDTIELRKHSIHFLKMWGPNYHDLFELQIGISIILCDICNLLTFITKSNSAYNGAYDICEICLKDYSYCPKCATYILTSDLNNPSHKHIASTSGSFILGTGEVNVWNADIMDVKGTESNKYFKTKQEHEIWKHQKESHIDLLHKAHTEIPFRYFGVELEVEKIRGGPPDMIERTVDQLDSRFVMLKHDGSLMNKGKNGFEIVTMPGTLAYHKSGVWDKFYDNLGSFFMYAPPTTGLHIHIGQSAVGRIVSGKMLVFINSKRNREFIESIAERDLGIMNPNGKIYANVSDSWQISDIIKLKQHATNCSWNPKSKSVLNRYAQNPGGSTKTDDKGNPIILSIKPRNISVRPACRCSPGVYNTTKYEAFNLMTKRPTVELRFFRGIISKTFLYSALEFADALVDYCSSASPAKLHYRDFLAWFTQYNASGQSKLYPNLSRHLINKSWIDPNKKLTLKPGTFSGLSG